MPVGVQLDLVRLVKAAKKIPSNLHQNAEHSTARVRMVGQDERGLAAFDP
jgi:hypothetical protein